MTQPSVSVPVQAGSAVAPVYFLIEKCMSFRPDPMQDILAVHWHQHLLYFGDGG